MVELDDGLAQTTRGAVQARREDAVSLLQELVRIPSVKGKEGAVGEVVGRAFSERGLDVDTWEATREETEPYRDHVGEQSSYEDRPNVVGVRSGTAEGRSILLNAHTDTVDPGDPTAWKGDPLSGNLEDDLLYGRGHAPLSTLRGYTLRDVRRRGRERGARPRRAHKHHRASDSDHHSRLPPRRLVRRR
ncbi:MAG TPA: hypothetical protein VK902_13405 [Rubrobacter sp.]|nr:hypothetical protein [Rubrobacter sp.]